MTNRKDYEIYYKLIAPVLRNDTDKKTLSAVADLKRNARAYTREEPKVTYLNDKKCGLYTVKKAFTNINTELAELYYQRYVEPHYRQHDRKSAFNHRIFKAGNKVFLYWDVEFK